MKAAENPFRSSEIARIRYRISDEELTALAAQVTESPPGIFAIIGPEGTGKTTLLEDLGDVLTQVRRISLTEDSRKEEKKAVVRLTGRMDHGSVCLLDGGEVLPGITWIRLRTICRKRGLRIVATLHKPRRLTVLYRTHPDWEATRDMVNSLAGDKMSSTLEAKAHAAHLRSSGNVREVFRACFKALMDPPTFRSS